MPQSEATALLVEALTKSYGDVRAVADVSFHVPRGSVFALLGPNGAGKTSTVECLAGFRRPDRGRVRVFGADPFAERARVTAVLGVMLQEGGAYQAATPRELLELYAHFYPEPLDPRSLLEDVGLSQRAQARYRSLSGGEKQRLNLALALVGRPRAVVLDEPTAGMDPKMRTRTWERIRRLREDGVAVLLCTHMLEEAERLADVVGVLDRGRLVAVDAPARLTASAANAQVLVVTPAAFDPAALARDLETAVHPDGSGRWLVEADEEAVPVIAAWFAQRRLPLSGVSVQSSLETAFLRLTAEQAP